VSTASTITENSTSISKVSTPQKIGEFWNSHSLADYSDYIREVSLEVDAGHTRNRAATATDSGSSTDAGGIT